MYNRYIPQSDGSYRCSRLPEPNPRHQQAPPKKSSQACTPPRQENRCEPASPGNFFRQILPAGFDTGDLLVVLLLLLIAGDDPRSRQTAILTLAFYFCM